MKGILTRYFGNSLRQMVSFFSREKGLTAAELEELKRIIEDEINSKEARDAELEAAAQEAAYSTDVVYTVADHHPTVPGGEAARKQFLTENLKYPESSPGRRGAGNCVCYICREA